MTLGVFDVVILSAQESFECDRDVLSHPFVHLSTSPMYSKMSCYCMLYDAKLGMHSDSDVGKGKGVTMQHFSHFTVSHKALLENS